MEVEQKHVEETVTSEQETEQQEVHNPPPKYVQDPSNADYTTTWTTDKKVSDEEFFRLSKIACTSEQWFPSYVVDRSTRKSRQYGGRDIHTIVLWTPAAMEFTYYETSSYDKHPYPPLYAPALVYGLSPASSAHKFHSFDTCKADGMLMVTDELIDPCKH